MILYLLFFFCVTVFGDICSHCTCDVATKSVTCEKPSLLVRTVSLLPYVERLHLKGLTLPHPPHILFHSGLKVLRINHCGLEDLSAHSLLPIPNLEVLDLADNHLQTLPTTLLRSLKHLKVVNLARNRITDLGLLSWILAENVVLEQLDLSGNPLALSTKNTFLPPTRQLFLADANLVSINSSMALFRASTQCPFDESCRALYLDAQDVSRLTTVVLSNNPKLDVDITALNLFENVSYFGLSQVILPVGFDIWLEERSAVVNLNISHSDVPLEESEWSWCGEQLETVDLSGIRMKHLSLERNCGVKVVHATDNLIETTKIEARSVEAVYLDRNLFTDWPILLPGVSLDELKTLSLSNNLLTSLPKNALSQFPALQHLDLSHNQLSEVDRLAFPSVGMQLVSLDLSSNQLTVLPHPILPSLLYLDASSNNLATIDPVLFAGLPLLQHLRLSNNPAIFTRCASSCWSDHLDELTGLVDLDLSNCQLSRSLPLSHLSSLRTLILRGNQILDVDASDLPQSVRMLDLGENRIHFTSNFSKLPSLRDLRVDLNPLRCDCSLHDIVPHLRNQSQIADSNIYYCYSGSWQYPLLPYLTSVRPCLDSRRSFVPMLLGTMAFSVIVICTFLLSFIAYKKYAHHCTHAYKRLATEIPPVRL